MKVNGTKKLIKETVEAIKFGQMDLFTKVIGRMIKLMEEADLSMLMEMYMKVNGRMTKPMAMVNICTLMALNMKVNGKKINNTVREKKHGLMAHAMKEIM